MVPPAELPAHSDTPPTLCASSKSKVPFLDPLKNMTPAVATGRLLCASEGPGGASERPGGSAGRTASRLGSGGLAGRSAGRWFGRPTPPPRVPPVHSVQPPPYKTYRGMHDQNSIGGPWDP